ncbi:MAG: anaerobic ribonucleoside-triphosphate reductase activating protein [Patescibacteria group bacterium]
MTIAGLQKFSLIDYPGKTCAIIFTRGCNFRCKYCHNPELVIPQKYAKEIPIETIFNFLEQRRNKLDAVCITGGEPTVHADLIGVIKKIKSIGFLIKLDSNGTRPDVLKKIIDQKLVNYIAMDVKAPLEKYPKITGCKISKNKIKQSIGLIINSGIDHEFRTTVVEPLTSEDDLKNIVQMIQGAQNYYLQKFVPTKTLDPDIINDKSLSDNILNKLIKEFSTGVTNCQIR